MIVFVCATTHLSNWAAKLMAAKVQELKIIKWLLKNFIIMQEKSESQSTIFCIGNKSESLKFASENKVLF